MRPEHGAVALVPRKADGGWRDDLWAWIRVGWWGDEDGDPSRLGFPIVEGHHDGELFNRAAAVNDAAARADGYGWDVAVILDADTILDPGQIRSAIILARASQQIVFGFDRYVALDAAMSDRIRRDRYRGQWDDPAHVALEVNGSCSSCVVVPRGLWDTVGGMDDTFEGWGFEDVAFSLACQSIGGGMHRIAGTVWHLWHPKAPATGDATHPIWQANYERCQPYVAVGHADAAGMEALLRAKGLLRRGYPNVTIESRPIGLA